MRSLSLLVPLALLSCSSKSSDAPATTTQDSGPITIETFAPKGCAYTVRHPQVEGFPSFEPHADVTDGDPQIRHVFRGLGGDVKAGAAGYADPSTSFAVGWQTNAGTLATKIRFGSSADKLDTELEGYSFLVPQEANVGPEEGIRFHEAHVCGLTAGRTYWYQVGGGDKWSATYSTTLAPAASGADPVKIGIVGDTRDALGNT
ncbi:MAG: fibronectin type III domain-containing protein, partial [Polyangiales bacterium]